MDKGRRIIDNVVEGEYREYRCAPRRGERHGEG